MRKTPVVSVLKNKNRVKSNLADEKAVAFDCLFIFG